MTYHWDPFIGMVYVVELIYNVRYSGVILVDTHTHIYIYMMLAQVWKLLYTFIYVLQHRYELMDVLTFYIWYHRGCITIGKGVEISRGAALNPYYVPLTYIPMQRWEKNDARTLRVFLFQSSTMTFICGPVTVDVLARQAFHPLDAQLGQDINGTWHGHATLRIGKNRVRIMIIIS